MTERYWAKPNWVRWLNVASVSLDEASSLSLGFEPQFSQEIEVDDADKKSVKWFHPAHTTDEGRDRLQLLRGVFSTEHLPAHEVPALPGHKPEQRVSLLDLVRFAKAQDWEIPSKLARLLPFESQAGPATETATPKPVLQAKSKRRSWWDVSSPYVVEIMQAGQYATAKELYNALDAKAGANSPFDQGTGSNRYSLFIREIAAPLKLKTVQNNWQKLLNAAAKK